MDSKTKIRPCEVVIHFKVIKEKMDYIHDAVNALKKAGITFDTGGYNDGSYVHYDWEFDWSLKGAKVLFKRFQEIK